MSYEKNIRLGRSKNFLSPIEIKNRFNLTFKVVDDVCRSPNEPWFGKVKKVILFGSLARGEGSLESDSDVMFLCENIFSNPRDYEGIIYRFDRLVRKYSDIHKVPFSINSNFILEDWYESGDNSNLGYILDAIRNEGKVIWEK